MCEASERGALLDRFGFVVRIDFNDVAHAVHFVAIVVAAINRRAELAVIPAGIFVRRARSLPAMAARRTLCAAVAI